MMMMLHVGRLSYRMKSKKYHERGLLYPSQWVLLGRDHLSILELMIQFGEKLLTQVELVQENDETS